MQRIEMNLWRVQLAGVIDREWLVLDKDKHLLARINGKDGFAEKCSLKGETVTLRERDLPVHPVER